MHAHAQLSPTSLDALHCALHCALQQVLLHAIFTLNIQTLLSPGAGAVGDPDVLRDRITTVTDHILSRLTPIASPVELTLTRFAVLRGYLAMHAKFNHVEGCVTAVRAVCMCVDPPPPPIYRPHCFLSLTSLILCSAYICSLYSVPLFHPLHSLDSLDSLHSLTSRIFSPSSRTSLTSLSLHFTHLFSPTREGTSLHSLHSLH
jgi:hypothetical protein